MSKPKAVSKVVTFGNTKDKNVKEINIETDIIPGDRVRDAFNNEMLTITAIIFKDGELFYEAKRPSQSGEPFHVYDEYERRDLRKTVTAEVTYEV